VSVQLLDKEGKLDPRKELSALRPVIWSRAKGTVKDALSLLQSIVARDPSLREEAAVLAVDALQHEGVDVQRAALAFLAAGATPLPAAVSAALAGKGGGVAASLRPQLAALLEPGRKESKTASASASAPGELTRRAGKIPPRWAALAGVPQALAALSGE